MIAAQERDATEDSLVEAFNTTEVALRDARMAGASDELIRLIQMARNALEEALGALDDA